MVANHGQDLLNRWISRLCGIHPHVCDDPVLVFASKACEVARDKKSAEIADAGEKNKLSLVAFRQFSSSSIDSEYEAKGAPQPRVPKLSERPLSIPRAVPPASIF